MMQRPAKIFFVLGSFKLGGTERTASRIGKELLKRGYEVKFLLVNDIFDYDDEVLIKNSIILTEGKFKMKLVKLLFVYLKLLVLVWKERPLKLISFSLGINMLIFFAFYPRTIFRIETNIFIYKKVKRYKLRVQKFLSGFPHITHIVVPSKGLYDACFEYFKRKDKLLLIDNPLDLDEINNLKDASLDEFRLLKPGSFIVSAGRLSINKGFEQLIMVYKKSRLYPTIKLLILGQGPLYGRLTELIENEGLQEYVILGGYQNNPYRFMAKSRFFILNSDHESFGNVLIEAFACDIPVVSNNCDFGPRHIIKNGYNGLLYDQHNETEFLRTIEQIAFDDRLYEKLRQGAIASKYFYQVKMITDIWVDMILR